ncbi:hypothetical protein [Flavobacterium sp. '19STA2R22 D10 B1']|uniref:hypothetical protein n=1 Tax=Flavobacterium aerium TaxID=3037261 RepID=UPI00278C13F6|nr:hypothetical protein [Flavobacterium sp. '19STA2R22 D10 B1']
MLNKGLRDEENEKINNVLATLISIVFVPDLWSEEDRKNIEKQLAALNLTMQNLVDFDVNALTNHLSPFQLDWKNQEYFADFLVGLSGKIQDQKTSLLEKSIGYYTYIQDESKTFSFDIFNKINAAKAKL